MSNKTCQNCKHLNRELAFRRACGARWLNKNDGANCKYFEKITPPTNGDKIIAGRMRAIAELANNRCQHCIYKNSDYIKTCLDVDCADGIEAWLNAPAESEGEDE